MSFSGARPSTSRHVSSSGHSHQEGAADTPPLSSSPAPPAVRQIPLPREREGARSPEPPSISSSLQNDLQGQGFSIDQLSDEQKARILRRHLVSRAEARRVSGEGGEEGYFDDAFDQEAARDDAPTPHNDEDDDTAASTYHARLGGEVVHDLYRWEDRQQQRELRRPRSASFTGSRTQDTDDPTLDIKSIREPGGFRRNFIHRKAADEGEPVQPERFTRSFIDFLSLYGQFAGEELEEIDEEDEEEEEDDIEAGPELATTEDAALAGQVTERTPLVRGGSSLKRPPLGSRAGSSFRRPGHLRRKSSLGRARQGTTTVRQAILMLLKSFVGTGVLFLGKAFENGGLGFSTIVLLGIASLSLYSFLLLIRTRLVVPHSFGDIGGILYGNWLRLCILFSITLSQIGFVSAYTVFVAQNLQAFVMSVTDCKRFVPIQYMILAQMAVYIPLAMFRDIQKLSGTALIADLFILIGLIYIFTIEFRTLGQNGIADVRFFNPDRFPLLIGTAVFAFEGIGLIIPITESMAEPQKFPKVLSGVMVFVMTLFAGSGILAYCTYGSDIQTVVLVNLPPSKFVTAVQFLYAVAISLSTPLQLFPAVRIMENGIFTSSGKYDVKVKWEKNAFRLGAVALCSLIAWAGARDLDKFVSLVGSLACVPLCFCYPAMLHFKIAKRRRSKIFDVLLFVFGVCAAIYTTSQTIIMLASGDSGAPPRFGNCPTPPQ